MDTTPSTIALSGALAHHVIRVWVAAHAHCAARDARTILAGCHLCIDQQSIVVAATDGRTLGEGRLSRASFPDSIWPESIETILPAPPALAIAEAKRTTWRRGKLATKPGPDPALSLSLMPPLPEYPGYPAPPRRVSTWTLSIGTSSIAGETIDGAYPGYASAIAIPPRPADDAPLVRPVWRTGIDMHYMDRMARFMAHRPVALYHGRGLIFQHLSAADPVTWTGLVMPITFPD